MLAHIVHRQSPAARELFHYELVLMLIEEVKAEIIERRTVDALERVTVRTVAGELSSIVKPDESDDMLERLKVFARKILNAERAISGQAEAN